MRIAQIVLAGASEYERKCQRVDRTALSEAHEVVEVRLDEAAASGAQVAHVYATGELPSAAFVRFPLPYVASADVRRSRWPWRRPVEPDYVVSPITEKIEQSRYQPLPEAVEPAWFEAGKPPRPGKNIIGTFARPAIRNMIEQTLARIHRFREDVTWHLFERVPTPADLASVDVWVDPAIEESDFDGFVAEALVVGVPAVASRTTINALRLEHGRTGFLVPPRDPNEMTHAILAALFKPEVAGGKLSAAGQTASKFTARQRRRVLLHMYDTIVP
ncbi:MAG TPA: glycosyltransferase [Thermoanaerobaculia bacterium]|nr:glycosyltransferase [Thermoanaerobaculia bacterium]